MRQPSRKALTVAEEILDHVNYGLTRPDIIREWAELIDENNLSLLEAANDLIDSAETNNGVPDQRYIRKLRAVLAEHQPRSETEPKAERSPPRAQHESAEPMVE
jgi:hypothetical protein